MASSKKTRKRKPSRQSAPSASQRYLVSIPRGNGHTDDEVDEIWFSNVDHVIKHCLTFGPQFFLDTHESPPDAIIIDTPRPDGSGVNLLKVPLDVFMTAVDTGHLIVHYGPWCPDLGIWED